jgi:hypothetical protein
LSKFCPHKGLDINTIDIITKTIALAEKLFDNPKIDFIAGANMISEYEWEAYHYNRVHCVKVPTVCVFSEFITLCTR